MLQDIADAISEPENAAAALPEGHPVRQALLAELANALNLRFRELGDPQDIDRAIEVFDSLASLPELPGRDPEDRATRGCPRPEKRHLSQHIQQYAIPNAGAKHRCRRNRIHPRALTSCGDPLLL